MDLRKQTTFSVSRGEAYELFEEVGFRKQSTSVLASSQPYKWFRFSARYTQWPGENYFPAPPLEPSLGNSRRINFGLTLRPSSRLRLDETMIYSRLGSRDGGTPVGFVPGENVFNNYLLQTKLNYKFTKELSLRLILG